MQRKGEDVRLGQAAPGGQTLVFSCCTGYLSKMHFEPNNIYHIYNRGNDKQTIFFNRNNYLFFLGKVRKEWLVYTDVLAYCLMPNHFHFLVVTNEEACRPIIIRGKETHMQQFSKCIGKTLSSYTQAINIQQNRTGNLFQKKTKAKAPAKKGWSKAAKGAAIGGASGAVVGAVVHKKNRVLGGVIGGVVGAGAGYGIGRTMDKKDGRYFMGQ